MRNLTYAQAINEGLTQAMDLCPQVLVLGQMVDYRTGVFGTTTGLVERFGPTRVQDFPICESLMTSTGIGAAVAGMRPVLVHQRVDFMMYSLDAIVNWLALWRFKSNGQCSVPVTIRAIVGKGWGQGPQHSKSLHAWFAHLPGLRVAIPATAYDAKGLMLESVLGENPTIIIEHRSLYSMTDHVPTTPYRVKFGQGIVRRPGQDLTLVAMGLMVPMAMRVAAALADEQIDIEVIDPRTLTPLDDDLLVRSVAKTGRLVVAEPGWKSVGVAGEVIARVAESGRCKLLAQPARVCFPDSHAPMSQTLEASYYPDEHKIAECIRNVLGRSQPHKQAA